MHILLYYSFTSLGIPSINSFAYWFLAVSVCVLIISPVWLQNQKILTIPSMWVLNVHTDLNLEWKTQHGVYLQGVPIPPILKF